MWPFATSDGVMHAPVAMCVAIRADIIHWLIAANWGTYSASLSLSVMDPPTPYPKLWDQTPAPRVGGTSISPLHSPPDDHQVIEDPQTPEAAIECGKRGMTYQPSRRKRVNSHGLEKRWEMDRCSTQSLIVKEDQCQ